MPTPYTTGASPPSLGLLRSTWSINILAALVAWSAPSRLAAATGRSGVSACAGGAGLSDTPIRRRGSPAYCDHGRHLGVERPPRPQGSRRNIRGERSTTAPKRDRKSDRVRQGDRVARPAGSLPRTLLRASHRQFRWRDHPRRRTDRRRVAGRGAMAVTRGAATTADRGVRGRCGRRFALRGGTEPRREDRTLAHRRIPTSGHRRARRSGRQPDDDRIAPRHDHPAGVGTTQVWGFALPTPHWWHIAWFSCRVMSHRFSDQFEHWILFEY